MTHASTVNELDGCQKLPRHPEYGLRIEFVVAPTVVREDLINRRPQQFKHKILVSSVGSLMGERIKQLDNILRRKTPLRIPIEMVQTPQLSRVPRICGHDLHRDPLISTGQRLATSPQRLIGRLTLDLSQARRWKSPPIPACDECCSGHFCMYRRG